MANTTFVDGETLIEASWLNDVNNAIYNPAAAVIPASSIVNTPAGNIEATDVQTALNELDSEKIATTAIGTTVQAYDAELTALATSTAAANKIPYYTGTTTAGTLDWNSATTLVNGATTVSSNTVIKSYVDASAIGVGQTWSLPVRAIATPYTNGTRPIQVAISIVCAGGSSVGATLTVGGVVIASAINNGLGTNIIIPISAVIPAGAVYRIDASSGAPSIHSWAELS